MVYRLNETTWLQDVGGGAEIFYFLNWAMLTIGENGDQDADPGKGEGGHAHMSCAEGADGEKETRGKKEG